MKQHSHLLDAKASIHDQLDKDPGEWFFFLLHLHSSSRFWFSLLFHWTMLLLLLLNVMCRWKDTGWNGKGKKSTVAKIMAGSYSFVFFVVCMKWFFVFITELWTLQWAQNRFSLVCPFNNIIRSLPIPSSFDADASFSYYCCCWQIRRTTKNEEEATTKKDWRLLCLLSLTTTTIMTTTTVRQWWCVCVCVIHVPKQQIDGTNVFTYGGQVAIEIKRSLRWALMAFILT